MFKRVIILILASFLLASCATGPEGYFKKSANNKLFDRKGFKGGKRTPLYNKKYIAKAKQNVANNDYDEDAESDEDEYNDLFEKENISQANRDMYRAVLEQEIEGKYLRKGRKNGKDRAYPVLVRNSATDNQGSDDNTELRAELEQIKAMLSETKNEMASYRCPTAKELEKAQANSLTKTPNIDDSVDNDKNVTNKNSKSSKVMKKDNPSESTLIQPVKSI